MQTMDRLHFNFAQRYWWPPGNLGYARLLDEALMKLKGGSAFAMDPKRTRFECLGLDGLLTREDADRDSCETEGQRMSLANLRHSRCFRGFYCVAPTKPSRVILLEQNAAVAGSSLQPPMRQNLPRCCLQAWTYISDKIPL